MVSINGLGPWLARSHVSLKTRIRDPVVAYANCSSLLRYNFILIKYHVANAPLSQGDKWAMCMPSIIILLS